MLEFDESNFMSNISGEKVEQKVGHRKNFVNARLFDRLFEAKNSSIESSIRKRLRKTAVFNHFNASACTPSQHRSILLL